MSATEWIERLHDKTLPLAARQEAAQALARQGRDYEAWKALCSVLHAEHEDPTLRCEVVRVLPEWNRLAAVEQLVRPYDSRPVRTAALATLEQLGPVTGEHETLLLATLAALRGAASDPYVAEALRSVSGDLRRLLSIEMSILRTGANPALTPTYLATLPQRYGRDPRVLAYLDENLHGADAQCRAEAAASLCALGEMERALPVANDPSPTVRARLAETLGLYREDSGADVLFRLINDSDPEVRRQAQKALRLLGKLEKPRPRKSATRGEGWNRLLGEISDLRLSDPGVALDVPDANVESGWLGEPGATEEGLRSAEHRLGVSLPPSYREFLAVSNGFRHPNPFIWRLYGIKEIDWFRTLNPDWIQAYQLGADLSEEEHLRIRGNSPMFRSAYLSSCLQISQEGDSAVVLLNPDVVNAAGEWEAWFFANWIPGADRYPSFLDFMQKQLGDLRNPSPPSP